MLYSLHQEDLSKPSKQMMLKSSLRQNKMKMFWQEALQMMPNYKREMWQVYIINHFKNSTFYTFYSDAYMASKFINFATHESIKLFQNSQEI